MDRNDLLSHLLMSRESSHWIRNAKIDFQHSKSCGKILPATISTHDKKNSYICSLKTAFYRYPKQETSLIRNRIERHLLRTASVPIGIFLQMLKIDRHISIGNWLQSTNLPPDLEEEELKEITQFYSEHYQDFLLTFRSVNQETHPRLFLSLKENGWQLIPARQVYLYHREDNKWKTKKIVIRERKNLLKSDLVQVNHQDLLDKDLLLIHRQYTDLFINKHSPFNPQITLEYIRKLFEKKVLEFHGLKDPKEDKLLGHFAIFQIGKIMTIPLIGYDISREKELGIYRMLFSLILMIAEDRELTLNMSSGAGNFKKLRGGKPVTEYTGVYTNHLPKISKMGKELFFSAVSKYGEGILQKNEI